MNTTQRLLLILTVTCLTIVSNITEANTQRAKAYFFVAEEAFENQDYQKTLEALDKVESMLGNSNARILALRIRTSYQLQNYQKAKSQLDEFWKMNASDDLVRSIASIDLEVEEKLAAEQKKQEEIRAKLVAEEKEQAEIKAKFSSLFSSFVNIPSGHYQMGSRNGDINEQPVHTVNIKEFEMMEHEVTWAMYQPCIDEGACSDNTEDGGDNGWGKGNRPVIEVSYHDIVNSYIPWLNHKTGQSFRLPTEAEWEYAARAGSSTSYSWGDNINCSQARYGQYYGDCGNERKTMPVKSYSSNQFGLYDMHGNVGEWVQDCYNDTYSGAPNNGLAWMSGVCVRNVLRGGSWNDFPSNLRSVNRVGLSRTKRNNNNGFRLVKGM